MGADSDEGEVEFPGVDAKIEKEDMEMSDMGPEDDVKIQGSNMEGKEPPPNVVEINDTDIPQDPSLIALIHFPSNARGVGLWLLSESCGPVWPFYGR